LQAGCKNSSSHSGSGNSTAADPSNAGWFVSYTNATAFSPTDTMPLSPSAKLLMILQSAASLLRAIMVVARAVNILK
jgi:hypothetical protein